VTDNAFLCIQNRPTVDYARNFGEVTDNAFFCVPIQKRPPADYALHLESIKVADYAFPHVQKRPNVHLLQRGKCIIAPGGPSGACQKAHSEP
jgi:hypothetical protein